VSGGKVADRIDPVIDISPVFAKLANDPRIVEPVSEMLGAAASLMKAKLITKRPGTMGYLPHQDFPYWEHMGLAADVMLSVQVAIDRGTPENGALELYPCLHRSRLPSPAGAPLDTDARALDPHPSEVVASEPGDLLCFHSLAPHQSGPNRAGHPRRTLYFTYAGGVGPEIYDTFRQSMAVAR
jgi:ectoine hydroxylase-related dioxygenase (phytanoyl-CoA dioxygenase family)